MSSSTRFAAILLVSPLLAACSGADFGVAAPAGDASLDGADPTDTSVTSDASDASDTSVTSDTSDTSVTSDAGAPADTSDPDVGADASPLDAPADAPPVDSCVPNKCGGCKALAQSPGDKCGSCGVLACGSDHESVVCNDPGQNLCNGCSTLAGKPGDPSGVGCGGGTYKCSGTELLACDGATLANKCGGCSALPHAVGSACGVCNGGSYVCDPSNNNAVICSDPVTTPAPGTACGGKCGSRTYACDAGGKSTSCGPDPVTTPAPGTACGGKCAGATYQCDSTKTLTTCVDPVPKTAPVITSACGVCGTSTNQCNATRSDVTCVLPDDRAKDPLVSQTTSTSAQVQPADRITTIFLPFTVAKRATRIATVSLELAREAYGCEVYGDCDSYDPQCTCNCTTYVCKVQPTTVADGLALELWTGTPAAPGALLDTATLKPTDVPAYVTGSTSVAPMTFSFAKDHNLAAATKVFVKLVVTGPSYSFRMYGDASYGSTSVPYYWQQLPGVPMMQGYAPYLVVTSYDCP